VARLDAAGGLAGDVSVVPEIGAMSGVAAIYLAEAVTGDVASRPWG